MFALWDRAKSQTFAVFWADRPGVAPGHVGARGVTAFGALSAADLFSIWKAITPGSVVSRRQDTRSLPVPGSNSLACIQGRGATTISVGRTGVAVAPLRALARSSRGTSAERGDIVACLRFLLIAISGMATAVLAEDAVPQNIAPKAKVTADSEHSGAYAARLVADGKIPAVGGCNSAGKEWAVQGKTHVNGATLTFEWPGPGDHRRGCVLWADELCRRVLQGV